MSRLCCRKTMCDERDCCSPLWKLVSHGTSYAEFREPPAVETSHLSMELAKKCQLSKRALSLAPPNFQIIWHWTLFPVRHWKDKDPISLILKIMIQKLFIQDRNSKWIFPMSPLRTFTSAPFSAFQVLSSSLYKAGFSLFGTQLQHHLFEETFPDSPG